MHGGLPPIHATKVAIHDCEAINSFFTSFAAGILCKADIFPVLFVFHHIAVRFFAKLHFEFVSFQKFTLFELFFSNPFTKYARDDKI